MSKKVGKNKWPGEGDSNSWRYDPRWFSRPVHSTALPSPDNNKNIIKTLDNHRSFSDWKMDELLHLFWDKTNGGDTRIRTEDQSFAGSCLTTWLCRQNICFWKVVPGAGLEPARSKRARDFKSLASTNSATRANALLSNSSFRRSNSFKIHLTKAMLSQEKYHLIYGAGNEVRTRDPDLGKVVLYHWAIPATKLRWNCTISFLKSKGVYVEF